MNETTAIAVRDEMSLADTMKLGKTLADSGFFADAKNAAKAVVKVLAGRELGFGPIASMTGIHIISGKPSVGANLIAAKIKGSGRYTFRIATLTNERCELAIFESGQELQPRSLFTIQDAATAGLTTGKNAHSWNHYPRNMLFARAISNAARWHCPELFSGAPVYTPEELGATVDDEGEIIDVVPVAVLSTTPESTKLPKQAAKEPRGINTNGNGKGVSLSEAAMKAILDAGHAENPANAARMVNLSSILTKDDAPEVFVAWAAAYRAARDGGKEAPAAAKVADAKRGEWA